MPFTGRNDFSLIRHLLTGSDKKACVVQKRNQKWWEKAVEEAEYLKLKSLRERLNFFDNLLTMKPIKKGKSSLIKSEIKSEPEDLLPPESPPKPVEKSPKKSKTKRKRTPKVKMEHFNPFSDLFSNELINEMNSECSFSDTDSLSKWSSTASSANVFEIEASRQRKNNLFRGVSRDKACQICKKTDKVIKCTGPCNGYFHHKCANLQFPFNAVTVKEKTEKRTINLLKKEIKQELITEFVPDTTDDNVEIVTSVREEKNENKSDVIYIDCDEVAVEHSLTPKGEQLSVKEFNHLSLSDKIDMKMKQIMQKFEEKNTIYADSTTDYTSSEEGTSTMSTRVKSSSKRRTLKVEHVTADCVTFGSENSEDLALTELKPAENETPPVPHITGDSTPRSGSSVDFDCKDFKCGYCAATIEPPCFICGFEVSHKKVALRQKCSLRKCGKFYHPHCVKMWPQTQWSLISTEKHRNSDVQLDTFVCPAHVCHTCASEDPRAGISRCNNSKVVKCIKCPATYHTTNYCVPAGSLILSTSQMICPRHNEVTIDGKGKSLKAGTINTTWCFICSKGGALICCETCPTSVHSECVTLNLLEDGTFICEDCESGRFPLYDDIVWVKFGRYRWWPAAVLFPNEIPARVMAWKRTVGQFVVRFYGTHNYYWADKGKVFLFQDGDNSRQSCNSKVAQCFKKAVDEALAAHQLRKVFKSNQEAEIRHSMKPPHYIRVKVNKPVGNVKLFDANISYTTACECNPLDDTPCGPDSVCLNRLLLTECDPNVCPAKEKCNNQRFEKRQYPPLRPFKTQGRGWGLKTLASIPKGSFVIEYVGEIIDEREYQRRIRKMHEQKDENYYFLTIDKDRIIDAGPKGNLARFMNHSCQPNCETQKWTVNGDTRVGLFAMDDIPADSEVTFNYNLECISKERKICRCGASTCSGFIGVKIKQDESQKKSKKSRITFKKKTSLSKVTSPKNENPCFVCGKMGVVEMCHNKICTKVYHLRCVQLKSWPEGKWVCPWHSCNICNKRTIRCCVKCVNSYCPSHSEGNVRHDKLLGFVCFEHDPIKESQIMPDASLNAKKCSSETTEETDVTSTTCEDEHNSFLKTSKGNEDNFSTIKNPNRSLISTSVKDTDLASFACNLEAYENDRIIDQFKIPNVTPINLQSKRRSKRSLKNRVSADNTSEETALFNSNSTQSYCSSNLIDIVNKKQIKLSPSVPIRHLRTTRQNSNSKQLYSPNSDLEKDLPMRKRSKPRSEAIV